MAARKRVGAPTTSTVTVTVVEPHVVFHDGEQRAGTLHDVNADLAAHWAKHGYVTIAPTTSTTTE